MPKKNSRTVSQLIEPLKKSIGDIENAYRGLSEYVDGFGDDISLNDLLNEYAKVKKIIGNYHNHLSFIANLMAIDWLEKKECLHYSGDAPTIKSQTATGFDIDFCDAIKGRIIGEIKTTDPTGKSSFGSRQKDSITTDFENLKKGHKSKEVNKDTAKCRYMFVTDKKAFEKLKSLFNKKNKGKLGAKDEKLLNNMICDISEEGNFLFKVVLLGSNEEPLILNELQ